MTRLAFILGLLARPLAAVDARNYLAEELNAFTRDYYDFLNKLRADTFDVRQARRLSRLWRRVENCGEWPK